MFGSVAFGVMFSLSCRHCQVVLTGGLVITNHVTQQLEVKVTTTRQDKCDSVLTLEPQVTAPSYVLEPKQMKALKVRLGGQKVLWSQEVSLCDDKSEQAKLLKVTDVRRPDDVSVTNLLLDSDRQCSSCNLPPQSHSDIT